MLMSEISAGQVAQGAEKVGSVAGTVSDVADYAKYGGMALQKGANLIGKGGQLASKAAPLVNIGGKIMKFLPGVGLVAAGADAVRRAAAGDYTGAALGAASGIAGMLPGLGTAASIGLTGIQAARDYAKHGTLAPSTDQLAAASGKGAADGFPQASAGNEPTAQAGGASATAGAQPTAQAGATQATASKGDPKVYTLQQQLIAKGAKIALDGKMGPQTQAAMQQFGMAEGLKERKMSQREHMQSLMEKLQCIEENPYLMEAIKRDDYLNEAYEKLSEKMGYKAAKDYILSEFKEIRRILKGFDKLTLKEQKIIKDIMLLEYAQDVEEMNIGNFRGMGGVGGALPNILNTGPIAQGVRTLGHQTTGGTTGPNPVQSTSNLFNRNAAYKQAQANRRAASTPATATSTPATATSTPATATSTPATATSTPARAAPTAGGALAPTPAGGAPAPTAAAGGGMMDKLKGLGAGAKNMAGAAGNWVKNNKGKLGLGALGLAGAAGLGMAGKAAYDWYKNKDQPPPTNPADIANSPDANLANDANKGAKKPGGGGQKPGPVKTDGGQKPAAGGLTPEELAELDAIAGEWENIQDPTIISLLGAYGQVRSKLGAPSGPPAVGGAAKPAAAPVAAQGGGAM